MLRKLVLFIGIGTLILIAGTSIAQATNIQSDDVVTVPKDTTIDASYYGAGSVVTIAGTVKGDVYCAGQNIVISGTIEGDVICAGQNIKISGTVQGDVRTAGQVVEVSGKIQQSASLFGQAVTVEDSAIIGNDLTIGGEKVVVAGEVTRDSVVGGTSAVLLGETGRNVTANAESLDIKSSAVVNGNLIYTSEKTATIDTGAVIDGRTEHKLPPKDERANSMSAALTGASYWFIAIFLTGLVLWLLAPKWLRGVSKEMRTKPAISFGLGFAALIFAPIVSILLFITVVGIPFGILLGAFWAFSLFASSVVVAYTAGIWGTKYFKKTGKRYEALGLLAASAAIVILTMLPWIGGWIMFLAILWGMGGITLGIFRTLRRQQV